MKDQQDSRPNSVSLDSGKSQEDPCIAQTPIADLFLRLQTAAHLGKPQTFPSQHNRGLPQATVRGMSENSSPGTQPSYSHISCRTTSAESSQSKEALALFQGLSGSLNFSPCHRGWAFQLLKILILPTFPDNLIISYQPQLITTGEDSDIDRLLNGLAPCSLPQTTSVLTKLQLSI